MSKKITVTNTRSGNPGQTGWNAILPPPLPANVLEQHITTDWLIIGGGFAGLAAARRMSQLRPDDRTVLLEAIRIGDGPAGRSSGFMIDLPHDISAESYTGAFDADKKQTEMNRTALTFAQEAADDYDFSQEVFDPRGKINVAASDFGVKHNIEYAEYLSQLGEPYSVLDAEDMKRITGTEYYSGGLHTPRSNMIQPAGFVRGLAQGLSLSGAVDIYENSPVISMQREGNTWLVQTPQGTVSTPKIILAVNGHIQSFGFFKQRLMHVFLYASMTRALTDDEVKRLGGEPVWDAVPADPLGSTVRRISGTGGDRILVRNKFHYSASLEAKDHRVQRAARDHDRSFAARFPMLDGVDMEYRWGGRLCLSWNSVPVFGEVEEGVYAAVCQNGLGASKGILSGMLAAEYATGTANPYIDEYLTAAQPTRLPPEPFASIGATVYLNWKERMAGREK
ncbi:MAG: FAD-binding oxidoreductase [Chloroflexota bacterium]